MTGLGTLLLEHEASIRYNAHRTILPKPPQGVSRPEFPSKEPNLVIQSIAKADPTLRIQRAMDHQDQSIVQSAIDDAIQASQKSQKRSHTEFQEVPGQSVASEKPPKIAKKNAFAAMMSAKPASTKFTYPVVTFEDSAEEFQQILLGQHLEDPMGHYDWGVYMAEAISNWFARRIACHLKIAPHLQTKINVLHVLIDIATGIAYTSGCKITRHISISSVPNFLLDQMYKLVVKMSTSEMKNLVEEKAFIHKVKVLRQQPLLKWESDTWNGLDDILRAVKDPGPVDFRRFYSDIQETLSRFNYSRSTTSGLAIVKIVRNDISPYVTRSTCFETKYNAMNILADICILLTERVVSVDSRHITFNTIFQAISAIGQMFNEEEVVKVVKEVQTETSILEPRFLTEVLATMESDCQNTSSYIPYGSKHHFEKYYGRTYSQRAKLKEALDNNSSHKSSAYGQKCLLVKILYLRHGIDEFRWETAMDTLDEVIALFPDRSTPLQASLILKKIDEDIFRCLRWAVLGSWLRPNPGEAKAIQKDIDRSISRVSKHASRGTSLEVKISALKILAEIGLRIVEWCHNTHPHWHTTIFQDHFSEDALTDAMMLISSSLSMPEWIKVMEDQNFLDDMVELDLRRSQIPESMEGLNSVLRIIRDPEHNSSKSSRCAKVVASISVENIIDLTDD